MRIFVAVTDYDWFQVHASRQAVDEVNFWLPSADQGFQALSLGEPLLFKLHSPNNYIAGGGFFTKFVRLPLSLAWEAFGEGNGVRTLEQARERVSKYRRTPIRLNEDPSIGCVMWSPKRNANGARNPFYEFMRELSPGDLVLSRPSASSHPTVMRVPNQLNLKAWA